MLIEIPEEKYQWIREHSGRTDFQITEMLYKRVRNGTPLPKGHGRLIDADVFEKRLMDARSYYIGEKADDFDLRFASGLKSAVERLVDAPTIIKADTESEDKE